MYKLDIGHVPKLREAESPVLPEITDASPSVNTNGGITLNQKQKARGPCPADTSDLKL